MSVQIFLSVLIWIQTVDTQSDSDVPERILKKVSIQQKKAWKITHAKSSVIILSGNWMTKVPNRLCWTACRFTQHICRWLTIKQTFSCRLTLFPQNDFLTLCILVSSADNLCKQFGSKSGPTICRVWSGSQLFDTLIMFLKEFFKKVNIRQQKSVKNYAVNWQRVNNEVIVLSGNWLTKVPNCMLIYTAHLSLAYNKNRLSHVVTHLLSHLIFVKRRF